MQQEGSPAIDRKTLLSKHHIRTVLSTHTNPKQAILELQEKCGLTVGNVKLALSFLDLLGIKRVVVYQNLLDNIRTKLEDAIIGASEKTLLALLHESYPYIMIPELKSIPISIIKKLTKVPEKYLKSLGNIKFRSALQDLPLIIRRQVWEIDTSIFVHSITDLCSKAASIAIQTPLDMRAPDGPVRQICDFIGNSDKLLFAFAGFCTGSKASSLNDRRSEVSESNGLEIEPVNYYPVIRHVAVGLREQGTRLRIYGRIQDLAWSMDQCVRQGRMDEGMLRVIVESLQQLVLSQPAEISARARAQALSGQAEARRKSAPKPVETTSIQQLPPQDPTSSTILSTLPQARDGAPPALPIPAQAPESTVAPPENDQKESTSVAKSEGGQKVNVTSEPSEESVSVTGGLTHSSESANTEAPLSLHLLPVDVQSVSESKTQEEGRTVGGEEAVISNVGGEVQTEGKAVEVVEMVVAMDLNETFQQSNMDTEVQEPVSKKSKIFHDQNPSETVSVGALATESLRSNVEEEQGKRAPDDSEAMTSSVPMNAVDSDDRSSLVVKEPQPSIDIVNDSQGRENEGFSESQPVSETVTGVKQEPQELQNGLEGSKLDAKEAVEPVAKGDNSPLLQAMLEEAWGYLCTIDRFEFFSKPVTEQQAPDYRTIVKTPMDLSTIRKKIEAGYKSFEDFDSDVELIVDNCKLYNPAGSPLYEVAQGFRSTWRKRKPEFRARAAALLSPPSSSSTPSKLEGDKSDKVASSAALSTPTKDKSATESMSLPKTKESLPQDILQKRIRKKSTAPRQDDDEGGDAINKNDSLVPPQQVKEERSQAASQSQPPPPEKLSSLLMKNSKLIRILEDALAYLESNDTYRFFLTPVTEDIAPGYFSVVKNPMDLSTMRKKIGTVYTSVQDLDADVDLMVSNARTFNEETSIVIQGALFLQAAWKKKRKDFERKYAPIMDEVKASVSVSNSSRNENAVTTAALSTKKTDKPVEAIHQSSKSGTKPSVEASAMVSSSQPAVTSSHKMGNGSISSPPATSAVTQSDPRRGTLVKILEEAWGYILKYDQTLLFMEPVTEDIAPGYFSVVKNPMDLSTMRKKIGTVYTSVQDLDADVDLMVENAHTYNLPGSLVYEAASKLRSGWRKRRNDFMRRQGDSGAASTHVASSTPRAEESHEQGKESVLASTKLNGATSNSFPTSYQTAESPAPTSFLSTFSPAPSASSQDPNVVSVLQEALSYLSRLDKEKDFSYPVTEDIAPGYFSVVKNPMDLSTMRKKIGTVYTSVQDLDADVDLMVENARTYNTSHTVVYTAAGNLRSSWRKRRKEFEKKLTNVTKVKIDEAPLAQPVQPVVNISAPSVVHLKDAMKTPANEPLPSSAGDVDKVTPVAKKIERDETQLQVQEKEAEAEAESTTLGSKDTSLVSILENAWSFLSKSDHYRIFATPVTEDIAPGYFSVVKNPMDLSTMRKKIGTVYTSVQDLDADVDLMVENAHKYNPPGTDIYQLATNLQKTWRKRMKTSDSFRVSEDDPKETLTLKLSLSGGTDTKKGIGHDFADDDGAWDDKMVAKREDAYDDGGDDDDDGEAEFEGTKTSKSKSTAGTSKGTTSERKSKSALGTPADTSLVAVLEEAWRYLSRQDRSVIFAYPVTEAIAPGYFSVIEQPMDLSRIRDKIPIAYSTLDDMNRDVNLMVNNAKKFNPSWTVEHQAADRLWQAWKKKRKEYFVKLYGADAAPSDNTTGGVSVVNSKTDSQNKPPMITDLRKSHQGGAARSASHDERKAKGDSRGVKRSAPTQQSSQPAKLGRIEPLSNQSKSSILDTFLQPKKAEPVQARPTLSHTDILPSVSPDGKLLISLCMLNDPSIQALLRQFLMVRLEKLLPEDKLPNSDYAIKQIIQLLQISLDARQAIPIRNDVIIRRVLPVLVFCMVQNKEVNELNIMLSELHEKILSRGTDSEKASDDRSLIEQLKTAYSTWFAKRMSGGHGGPASSASLAALALVESTVTSTGAIE